MAKKSALVLGIIFILVGILGFIPGHGIVGSGALFEANGLHNVVHLILGIVLVIASRGAKAATTLIVIGVIYLLLAIIGFIQGDTVLGIVPVNAADNWLHLVLAIVTGALGFAGKKGGASSMPSPSVPPAPQM